MFVTWIVSEVLVIATGAIAKSLKTWRAGKDLKENDTAIMEMLITPKELNIIESSDDANAVRGVVLKGYERFTLAKPALGMEGAN